MIPHRKRAESSRSACRLLRDLAAEVGAVDHEILQEALRTVGLNAEMEGSVPTALREVADSVAHSKEVSPQEVADIARVGHTDTEISWEEITEKPRGETGRAISEMLDTYDDDSVEPLQSAVASEYQLESDAANLDPY